VCPQVVGKQLVSALKSAAVGAGGALRDMGWSQLMRNRLASGLASAAWGGRSVQTLEPHALGAADFTSTTAQEMDEFVVPTNDTAEARPRPAATWDEWLRRARRGVNVFAMVYGEEHRPKMMACLEELAALQEEQPTMLPKQVAQDIWEELHWRFWEEVREALRQMRREIGRDSATREQLAFCALMPARTLPRGL